MSARGFCWDGHRVVPHACRKKIVIVKNNLTMMQDYPRHSANESQGSPTRSGINGPTCPTPAGQGYFPICFNEGWKEPRHTVQRKPAMGISGESRCCWGPTSCNVQLRFCLGAPKPERRVCSFGACLHSGQVPVSVGRRGWAHLLP